jgi:hypothetical protein
MDDVSDLRELNEWFIEAIRKGSWDMLGQILSPSFVCLNAVTGEIIDRQEYIDAAKVPEPGLSIDQVNVHVDGNAAVVSARSLRVPGGRYIRYADTYDRSPEGWRCVHAVAWQLP